MKKEAGTLVVAAVLLCGCSRQDFDRPMVPSFTDPNTHIDRLSKLQEAERSDERSRQMAKVLSEWRVKDNQGRDYHAGADDILEIGVLSLEQVGEISKLVRTIQNDGTVSIPWVGAIPVAGLTIREIEEKIRTELAGRFIKNPEVTAIVSQFRSAPVVMTGAVNKPGVYFMKNDRRSILEMLAEADGLSREAGDRILLLRGRMGEVSDDMSSKDLRAMVTNSEDTLTIDIEALIDEGDLRLNLWVKKGDIISIPPRLKEYIYILGYVNRPGAFEIDGDNPPSALQAVALAGGLGYNARAQNSFLLRPGPQGREQEVVPVDLTKMASKDGVPLMVASGDTLVVGTGFFARLGEIVHPVVNAGASVGPSGVQ